MIHANQIWLIGQVVSFVIGALVGVSHGVVGVATWYALAVLVDIRREVTKQ